MPFLKLALVSPYDFAYPGGVTEHVSNLAEQFMTRGHQVHIVAAQSDHLAAQATLAADDLPAQREVGRLRRRVLAGGQLARGDQVDLGVGLGRAAHRLRFASRNAGRRGAPRFRGSAETLLPRFRG